MGGGLFLKSKVPLYHVLYQGVGFEDSRCEDLNARSSLCVRTRSWMGPP